MEDVLLEFAGPDNFITTYRSDNADEIKKALKLLTAHPDTSTQASGGHNPLFKAPPRRARVDGHGAAHRHEPGQPADGRDVPRGERARRREGREARN